MTYEKAIDSPVFSMFTFCLYKKGEQTSKEGLVKSVKEWTLFDGF